MIARSRQRRALQSMGIGSLFRRLRHALGTLPRQRAAAWTGKRRHFTPAPWLFLTVLVSAALACNLPSGDEPLPEPPTRTTATATPATTDVSGTATRAPSTLAPGTLGHTPRPTFTRIGPGPGTTEPTPAIMPTHTPSPTVGSVNTVAPPTGGGPLSFTYELTWALDPNNAQQAIATVRIFASGGSGSYTYYRDELPTGGSVFSYTWATCRGNPGSLRVDSSDGQSVRQEYFAQPPCPQQ